MKLISNVITPSEKICFGPFCDALKQDSTANASALSIVGSVLGKTVNLFIVFSAFVTLFIMFLGAFDWVTSDGDKEKVSKAQKRITGAFLGLFIVLCVWTVWTLLTGGVLGIFERGADGGIIIKIPSLLD
jgi:hypothetical protein